MTVVNHAALGAVIALSIKEPVLVLPLAVISHYFLDIFPHFGYPGGGGFGVAFKHRLTYFYGLLDFIASIFLIFLLWDMGWLVYLAAFLAVLPDIFHIYRYFFKERKGLSRPDEGNILSRFHHNIQWGHYPWGNLVEILTAILLIELIFYYR